MSSFKAILVTILTFYSSSSLMGMHWFSWKKKYNPEDHNYLSEDVHKLLLFSNATIKDRDNILVPADLKRLIIQDGCDIYCKELFESEVYSDTLSQNIKFRDFWQSRLSIINNKGRITQCQGKEIKINNFDFITMTDEGRRIFYRASFAIQQRNGKYICSDNTIEKCILDGASGAMRLFIPLSTDEFNKTLKLPLGLKRNMGLLSKVKAVDKEIVSSDAKWDGAKVWAFLGGILGTIGGGVWSGDYEALHALGLALEAGTSSSPFSRHLAEQEMNRIKYSPEGVKSIFLGGCTGTAVGAFVGLMTARDSDHNKVFSVEEKPLLTLKEQETIKKIEGEKDFIYLEKQNQIEEVKPIEQSKKYMYTAVGKVLYRGKFYKKTDGNKTTWMIKQ